MLLQLFRSNENKDTSYLRYFDANKLISKWVEITKKYQSADEQFKQIMLQLRDSFNFRIYTVYIIHFLEPWFEEFRRVGSLAQGKAVHLS